jgi:metal-responsive CopG/Arc/MetJ family transcriptional regulator
MNRGVVKTSEAVLVAVWIPRPLLAAIDEAVRVDDTDRSKFARSAIRAFLARRPVCRFGAEAAGEVKGGAE